MEVVVVRDRETRGIKGVYDSMDTAHEVMLEEYTNEEDDIEDRMEETLEYFEFLQFEVETSFSPQ